MAAHPVSDIFFNHDRLAVAITRLCSNVVGHSHFLGVSQVVGTSIKVGIRIFSIVTGLGLEGGRYHGCELLRPVGLGLCLPHKLRMLAGEQGEQRSLWKKGSSSIVTGQ